MRANVNRGKLIAPKTLGVGLKRRKQLAFEIGRIEGQLTETGMPPSRMDDSSWRVSAERALKLFQLEARLLDEWIDVRKNDSESLLRECYEIMKVLEGQVDFKSHEARLMEKLDDYFQVT